MAKNDGLEALIGLGILGAMMDSDPLKGVDTDTMERRMNETMKRHMNEKYGKKPVPADGAKAAKELYDAYVEVGFNEVQAFELLKLLLTR